jgi:hypothetical protein
MLDLRCLSSARPEDARTRIGGGSIVHTSHDCCRRRRNLQQLTAETVREQA